MSQKFQNLSDLEHTLFRLLDLNAQPGTDQDGNLLLLSLVNLMGIVGVMQKQLSNDEAGMPVLGDIKNDEKDLAVNYGSRSSRISVPDKKDTEKSILKRKSNNKIVNKINNQNEPSSSKVIKWDSRLNKKIKEPLYI